MLDELLSNLERAMADQATNQAGEEGGEESFQVVNPLPQGVLVNIFKYFTEIISLRNC